jgi:hypothetical protein
MADRNDGKAERETRNRGLQEEDERQHDPKGRTPHRVVDQSAPEQVRPTTPDEEANEDIAQLENPPQAEGPRERNNEGV